MNFSTLLNSSKKAGMIVWFLIDIEIEKTLILIERRSLFH